MLDTPRILQTAAQPTAVIHITTPREQIRVVMGPGYAELMATLSAQGIVPCGPWFTRHFKMEPGVFDFEIGVPISGLLAAAGRVTPGQLPAVTAARTIYRGAYEGLPTAWPELDGWITSHGRKPGPSLWETYLTDPKANPDPATWMTELTRPLAE